MYAEVGAALGNADFDDLYDTIVEDLALKFSIVDPKGGGRSLTAPISAIYFNAGDYADCPFALIATGREAEIVDRLMSSVHWNNEEADHDPQEPSAPATDMAVSRRSPARRARTSGRR
jgi:hypothetical protein